MIIGGGVEKPVFGCDPDHTVVVQIGPNIS